MKLRIYLTSLFLLSLIITTTQPALARPENVALNNKLHDENSTIIQGAAEPVRVIPNYKLPVRRVVLYKHGVGYFERRGTVPGQENVNLYFKSNQMNDLLKSLTVLDLGDGPLGGIVYDSTKTVEQLLSDYTFNLRGARGLPDILGQLQGSEIELSIGSDMITGTIISVETRIIQEDDTKMPVYYLSVMENSGQLRSFNTNEIRSVKFLDQRLDQDIKRYMKTLYQQHRRDEKILTIRPEGPGQRDLLVSYVCEAPIWKATYRIVLEKDQDKKPFLQGWAIVDNVSEEDWNNVELSLVSGLPISFIQDLYNPWFKKRPVIEIEEEIAMAPTIPQGGIAMNMPVEEKISKGVAARSNRRLAKAPAPAAAAEMAEDKAYGLGMMGGMGGMGGDLRLGKKMQQLQAETVTREVGDLFEYKIDHPVTVARNRSAMLPIAAAQVEGSAVALYNESARTKNPLAAVRLKNTTGLTLEGGPLTVFQEDSYVGEALIKTVKPDEQRYITYAVDLGTHVNTKIDSKSERIDRVIINRGTMRMHRAVIETKTYNLDNKDKRDKTVVIEHPLHTDWKLLNQEKPIEVTDSYKRFEVKLPAGKPAKFTVKEERDRWDDLAVTNITPEQILIYARDKYITEQTRKQLDQIVAIKAEIVNIDRSINQLQTEKNSIFSDQQRLRDNLKSLGRTEEENQLRSRYIGQLTQQESRLEAIDKTTKDLQDQKQAKQKQLDEMIESLAQDLTI
ncbi:MAG: hypothetical protein JXD22_15300 [Sedimentisphaerales bacterium]|nr:hypothetical protein [Sedimentisphaerales bacterium]